MSTIALVEQASTPATPTTGKVRIYVGTGGTLQSVDDAGAVTIYGAGLTQEQVEDYVGGLLQDSSTVDVTYNDAGNAVTFTVIAGGVNHNALLNYVANQHVDHSTVSISAGVGLTGGGDITANRTISMPNVGTAGTYQSVTTDAQGRVTAGTNPTTLSGFGITDAQPLDADLTALAGLTGSGVVIRTGAGTATTRAITASTGMTVTNGDGVSGNPTVAITNSGVTAATYGSATQVPQVAINAQGQTTSASNVSIAIPSTQITDFAEAVQDVMGGALTDSSSIDFQYNDVANTQTAVVLPAGVDHNSLANLTTGNPHTQYLLSSTAATTYQPLDGDLTAVAALAGTGLVTRTAANTMTTRTLTASTGVTVSNGDGVSGNPTVAITNTAVTAGSYGSASAVPNYTVNAQGQLTAAASTSIQIAESQVTNLTTDLGLKADKATTITAGTYMSGGGDLSANRTINHANSAVTAGSYGGVNAIPVLGIGATGHVDSASTVNTTSAILTGLSATLGGGTVAATDTILQAFNKMVGESNNWTEICCASTYTNTSNTTGVNITEFTISCTTGRKYYYEAVIIYQTANVNTGISVTATTPDTFSAPGALMVNATTAADGTASLFSGTINTLGDYVTTTGVQTANVPFVLHVKGNFPCSASGTLNLTFRSEVNGSQVTVSPGSTLLVREFV